MALTVSLLVGVLLGALLAAALVRPRMRLVLDELQLIRRDRDRLQGELHARRAEVSQIRMAALQTEQESLMMRRRLMAALAERDQARLAQLGADAAYRDILAERDRLLGELALSRRRRALP